jgi:ADP-sugar diphosphatase
MLFRSAFSNRSYNLAQQLTRLPTRHQISSRVMSTFTLPGFSPECPVHLTSDLKKEQLLSFPAFKTWSETLQHSLKQQESKNHTFHEKPYKLRKIDVQSVDFFGGERIGFIKFKAEVSNDDGEKFPGSVFLRGGSVAMLVSLHNMQVRKPRQFH